MRVKDFREVGEYVLILLDQSAALVYRHHFGCITRLSCNGGNWSADTNAELPALVVDTLLELLGV